MIQGRDPWDDLVTTDERWTYIVFKGDSLKNGPGSDWKTMSDAEEWAKAEFGNGFFRLGYKFFFDDPSKLMLFQLRWS